MKNFASKARMVSKIFEAHARATLLTWETVQDLSINTFWQNYDYTITLIQRRKKIISILRIKCFLFVKNKQTNKKKEQTKTNKRKTWILFTQGCFIVPRRRCEKFTTKTTTTDNQLSEILFEFCLHVILLFLNGFFLLKYCLLKSVLDEHRRVKISDQCLENDSIFSLELRAWSNQAHCIV